MIAPPPEAVPPPTSPSQLTLWMLLVASLCLAPVVIEPVARLYFRRRERHKPK